MIYLIRRLVVLSWIILGGIISKYNSKNSRGPQFIGNTVTEIMYTKFERDFGDKYNVPNICSVILALDNSLYRGHSGLWFVSNRQFRKYKWNSFHGNNLPLFRVEKAIYKPSGAVINWHKRFEADAVGIKQDLSQFYVKPDDGYRPINIRGSKSDFSRKDLYVKSKTYNSYKSTPFKVAHNLNFIDP